MDRALSRLDWRPFAWAALLTVNFILVAVTVSAFFLADIGNDWWVYREAGERVFGTGLYEWGDSQHLVWRYSPVMAWGFAALAPIGFWGWAALHFAALLLIPRRLALYALLSFPFWVDVYNGNTLTFVFVAAVLALRGSRGWSLVFLALCLLIPRPFMLPVMAWLLWKDRGLWLPFLGLFAVHAALVLVSGWGPEWMDALLFRSSEDPRTIDNNWSPSALIGSWWLLIGVPLAGWLTWRGRLGLASLAISPYLGVSYWLMGLLEFLPRPATVDESGDGIRARRATVHEGVG